MPKSVLYRANTIIYFQGDIAEHVLVLKEGKVKLTEKSEFSDSETTTIVQQGELFGMKAAVAGAFHNETALAVKDSNVLHLDLFEFEKIITGNYRVLMKILCVLSSSLRQHHQTIKKLLDQEMNSINPETGLFSIGEYFFNKGQYSTAIEAYKRYLNYWPKGTFALQAMTRIGDVSSVMEKTIEQDTVAGGSSVNDSDINSLTEADNAYEKSNYNKAYNGYLNHLKKETDPEKKSYIEFRIGCCLYYLLKYTDSIKQLTATVKKYPQHADLNENIYYLGLSYKEIGKKDKAIQLFIKAKKMETEGSSLYERIMKKMKETEIENGP